MSCITTKKIGRPCGNRAKFVLEKCRCFACSLANADYITSLDQRNRVRYACRYSPSGKIYVVRDQQTGEILFRSAERDMAKAKQAELNAPHVLIDPRELIDITAVRNHLNLLSKCHVGYKRAADLAGVSRNVVARMIQGEIKKTRRSTAEKILAVRPNRQAARALVDARATWRLLDELIAGGHTKLSLAQLLGKKGPALQIGRVSVTASTAQKIDKLYRFLTTASEEDIDMAKHLRAGKYSGTGLKHHGPATLCAMALKAPAARKAAYELVSDGEKYIEECLSAGREIDRVVLAEITGMTPADNTGLIEMVRGRVAA